MLGSCKALAENKFYPWVSLRRIPKVPQCLFLPRPRWPKLSCSRQDYSWFILGWGAIKKIPGCYADAAHGKPPLFIFFTLETPWEVTISGLQLDIFCQQPPWGKDGGENNQRYLKYLKGKIEEYNIDRKWTRSKVYVCISSQSSH